MRLLAVWMRSSSRGVALLPCDAASEPAAAGAEVMIGAFLGPFQNLTRRAKRRPATGASSMQSRMAFFVLVAAAALQRDWRAAPRWCARVGAVQGGVAGVLRRRAATITIVAGLQQCNEPLQPGAARSPLCYRSAAMQ